MSAPRGGSKAVVAAAGAVWSRSRKRVSSAGVEVPGAAHHHPQRQTGRRVGPDVDRGDRGGVGGRGVAHPHGVHAGHPGRVDPGQLLVGGLAEQPAAQRAGQQVRRGGQRQRRGVAAAGPLVGVVPGPGAGGVAVRAGLAGGGDHVDPPVPGTAVPSPQRRLVREQVGDAGERVGDRQDQAAGGDRVAGEGDVVAGQHPVAQVGRRDRRVVGRQRRDQGGQGSQHGQPECHHGPAPPPSDHDPPYDGSVEVLHGSSSSHRLRTAHPAAAGPRGAAPAPRPPARGPRPAAGRRR